MKLSSINTTAGGLVVPAAVGNKLAYAEGLLLNLILANCAKPVALALLIAPPN
ncbi:hypothetical protein D3C85_954850 [compost metagenome]